jgi:nitrogen fixation NifU-like protein
VLESLQAAFDGDGGPELRGDRVDRQKVFAGEDEVMAFSEAVLEHFRNPRHSGELQGATHRVEVTNPVCGDVLQLAARIEDGKIREAGFLCRGCTTAIACASWVTEQITGMSLKEAAGVDANAIATGLGGLPEETRHGAILAAEAVKALFQRR